MTDVFIDLAGKRYSLPAEFETHPDGTVVVTGRCLTALTNGILLCLTPEDCAHEDVRDFLCGMCGVSARTLARWPDPIEAACQMVFQRELRQHAHVLALMLPTHTIQVVRRMFAPTPTITQTPR